MNQGVPRGSPGVTKPKAAPAPWRTTGPMARMRAATWVQPRSRPMRSLTARVKPRPTADPDERLERRHGVGADPRVGERAHGALDGRDDELRPGDRQGDLHVMDDVAVVLDPVRHSRGRRSSRPPRTRRAGRPSSPATVSTASMRIVRTWTGRGWATPRAGPRGRGRASRAGAPRRAETREDRVVDEAVRGENPRALEPPRPAVHVRDASPGLLHDEPARRHVPGAERRAPSSRRGARTRRSRGRARRSRAAGPPGPAPRAPRTRADWSPPSCGCRRGSPSRGAPGRGVSTLDTRIGSPSSVAPRPRCGHEALVAASDRTRRPARRRPRAPARPTPRRAAARARSSWSRRAGR